MSEVIWNISKSDSEKVLKKLKKHTILCVLCAVVMIAGFAVQHNWVWVAFFVLSTAALIAINMWKYNCVKQWRVIPFIDWLLRRK